MDIETAKENVLKAINYQKNKNFRTLGDAIEEYGAAYIFDEWLRYEGIIGYTRDILAVLNAVGMLEYEEEW